MCNAYLPRSCARVQQSILKGAKRPLKEMYYIYWEAADLNSEYTFRLQETRLSTKMILKIESNLDVWFLNIRSITEFIFFYKIRRFAPRFAPPWGKTPFQTGKNAHGCFLSHSHFKLIFFGKYWFLCLKRIICLDQIFYSICMTSPEVGVSPNTSLHLSLWCYEAHPISEAKKLIFCSMVHICLLSCRLKIHISFAKEHL